MNIEQIKVWDHTATFKEGSYANAQLKKKTTRSRVVEIDTGEDWTGYGEVVFPFALSPEAQEKVIEEEVVYLPSLLGGNVDCLMSAATQLRARERHWSSVAFALETAWYDFEGKRQKVALWSLLNCYFSNNVLPYRSISLSGEDELRDRLRLKPEHEKIIQLKLINRSWTDDMARITQILDHHPRIDMLLADANGKWSVSQACEIISRFRDPRIIWEEPCATYLENAEVEKITGQSIMVDQSVGDLAVAERAVCEGAVSAITVKPAYLGGLSTARYLLDRCVEKGVRVRVDGPWCGGIGAAAVLHLAAGVEQELLIASCDLQGPLDSPAMLRGAVELPDGKITPPPGPGLGLRNHSLEDILGRPEAIYSI
tara:strand:- start:371 stop:1480 length:1110 start_codon:yes stop_codon:yes gene_type:complete